MGKYRQMIKQNYRFPFYEETEEFNGDQFEGSSHHWLYVMHLYFIVFKNKKEDDYKLFTNTVFDKEKDADDFGRKSMKRGYEHKVLEYNNENHDRYWNGN